VNWGTQIQGLENALVQIIKADILPAGAYLAGGTALYFYLHHRLSIDLDFFSPQSIKPEIIAYKMKESLEDADVEIMEKDSLIVFLTRHKIKCSLFYLPYELLAETTQYSIQGGTSCPLASFQDIEAMKALAVSQRGSAKDFVDLFFLLQRTRHTFNDVALQVQIKYGLNKGYDYHLKTSLAYFDDADKEASQILLAEPGDQIRPISKKEWDDIKQFFVGFCR
jgi:predicted nucleotidyltransferase component of viral defense system